jgi:hypothetical protein
MGVAGYTGILEAIAAMAGGGGPTWRPVTYERNFPGFDKAWAACTDETQFQVWDCSRRSAKTGTATRRTVMRSSERANHRTLYIHHTRTLAKMQFFETGEAVGSQANPGVIELLRQHGIAESRHDLSELWVRLTNGSFVQAVGCDDIRDVDRKLGYQWDDILIDECQDHRDDILRRLVDKTLLPTLVDRGGSLTLMGTPPEVLVGIWQEVSDPNSQTRFKRHHWTLLDNPFIAPENIVKVYEGRGFVIDFDDPTNNDPVVQREIFGLHVIDPAKFVYCYSPLANDYGDADEALFKRDGIWRFAMGIDIGGVEEDNDADAITVLGWMTDDPERRIWEREVWSDRGDSEEFVDRIEKTYHEWQPMVGVCGDTGGAGAVKALASFKKRIRAGFDFTPKPTSAETSQRLLNDDLRSRRFRTRPKGLLGRSAQLCLRGKHEHDIMASARYAHHCAYHFLAKEPAKKAETQDEIDRRNILRRKQMQNEYLTGRRSAF